MVFLHFIIFMAVTAHVAQAFPAQSIPSSLASPYIFQPGTLLGRHYTLRMDPAPDSFVETHRQPDHSGPVSRALRFEVSQRKRGRSISEDDAAEGQKNLLSNVHPEPVLVPTQTSASESAGAGPTHNTSITLIPHPTSAAFKSVKTSRKHHKAVEPTKKLAKLESVQKE
jgi:hypothetical protein